MRSLKSNSDRDSSPRLLLKNPRAVGVQFRYAFVTDDEGFKVLDVTEPTKPKLIPGAFVPLKQAQRFYLARTYAYVADGADGLAFIDISNPEKPKLEQLYNADGKLTDTRAVQIGSVSASEFALVADGKNGLQILQLISPENVPEHMGFGEAQSEMDRRRIPTKSPPSPSRADWIATAWWMKAATRPSCLAGAARVRSTWTR